MTQRPGPISDVKTLADDKLKMAENFLERIQDKTDVSVISSEAVTDDQALNPWQQVRNQSLKPIQRHSSFY